jgi:predicted HTH transcriptional regulator
LPGAAELIAAGESATVEFKSSARFNLHTRARDPKLELVIATAVAGFSNARGGSLLIGVADDGTVLGLAEDYALLRQADADRYQLWLRDLFTTTLGAPVAAQVEITFPHLDGQEICLIRVPAAHRPVFLRAPKQTATQFVARIGNSTRELRGQEMLHYAVAHWPARALAGPGRRR